MEAIEYNGFKFYYSGKYYRGTVVIEGKKREILLHRYVYMCEVGEIPEKHHIHHRDGNKLNNDISNLECLTMTEHFRFHARTKEYQDRLRAIQPLAIEAAKEWHRSEEGSKWHSEHAKKVFANKPFRKITCGFCNKEYETNAIVSKFCSNNCKSANRRKISKETGLDMEDRKCKTCDNVFNINKYSSRALCRDCFNYGCNTKYKKDLSLENI